MFNKSCLRLDSNPGPLTALQTVPQPLPKTKIKKKEARLVHLKNLHCKNIKMICRVEQEETGMCEYVNVLISRSETRCISFQFRNALMPSSNASSNMVNFQTTMSKLRPSQGRSSSQEGKNESPPINKGKSAKRDQYYKLLFAVTVCAVN